MKKYIPYEWQIQVPFMQWANLQYPNARAFAIPNGGRRDPKTGAQMKREGVRPNIPDIMFPVSRQGFCGLFIEFKRPGASVPKAQREMHAFLREQGYRVEVCRSVDEGREVVNDYMKEGAN